MAGYEGAAIPADQFLANIQQYYPGAIVPSYQTIPQESAPTAPTYSPEPDYSVYSFGPSFYSGSTDDFFRAISGAPSAPYVQGISEPPSPIWMAGGDMDTMTLTARLDGGAIGSPKVDESMASRVSTAMILPDGQPDWGKWIIVAGVLVTLYIIGREMSRKGSTQ